VSEPPSDEVVPNRRRPLWQRVGGEGFVVSVTIHVILVLIAAFLIISVTKESVKKDPGSFDGFGRWGGGRKGQAVPDASAAEEPEDDRKNPGPDYDQECLGDDCLT